MGIFCLSIVTMSVAIARTIDINATAKANGLPDSSYLCFWYAVQSVLCMLSLSKLQNGYYTEELICFTNSILHKQVLQWLVLRPLDSSLLDPRKSPQSRLQARNTQVF